MEELYLKKIELSDEEMVTNYLSELVRCSGAIKGFRFEDGLDFKSLVAKLNEYEKIKFESYDQLDYPSYQYMLVRKADNKAVGAVEVRPFLTKHLDLDFEGNIGYSVSASERGKGYAKVAMQLAIEKFKELNKTDDIIVCCYKENEGSKKVILRYGGELIEEVSGVLSAQKYLIKRS